MRMNPFDFTGRVALVTGCGSGQGIGFASARLLTRLGAKVSITSTTQDRLGARAAELVGEGATVFARVADLTQRADAVELAAAVREEHGPIDVLVNSAGMAQTGTPPVSASFAELDPTELAR